MKDKWPTAFKAITAFTIDNDEMGKMITEVDLNGKKVEEVVAAWMAANEARWSAWISDDDGGRAPVRRSRRTGGVSHRPHPKRPRPQ